MEDFLKILSVRRHDFLNHIQVISGYLQLNKIERAKEYLKYVAEELSRESQLFNCRSGQVAVAILNLQYQVMLAGVKLAVRMEASLENSRVPEEVLLAIIRIYGLALQEFSKVSGRNCDESCLLEVSEQAVSMEWKFGIPGETNLAREFQEGVGRILRQEGLENLCSLNSCGAGVCLTILKKLETSENGNTIGNSAATGAGNHNT